MDNLIEKIISALFPIVFACVGYLLTTLSDLGDQVTVLNSKMSLVVTADNKQSVNTGAELAREKLRQDLTVEIQNNRDMILENKKDIAILEERLRFLSSLLAK